MGSPVGASEVAEFDSATFLAASAELLSAPSEAAVTRFLRSFSLASVLAALQASSDPDVHRSAIGCLRNIVKADCASGQLPSFMPAIEQGLSSPLEEIQGISCLAAQRIGEVSAASFRTAEKDKRSSNAARELLANKVLVRGLLDCVAGASVTLAMSAADAIYSLSTSYPGAVDGFFTEPSLTHLRNLLTHPPTAVQQRVISLCIRLVGASDAAATPVQTLGVLEVLLDMIGGQGYCRASLQGHGRAEAAASGASTVTSLSLPDELTALTACELLTDFVRQPGPARILKASPHVAGALLHLLRLKAKPGTPQAASGSIAGLIVCAAWKAVAYLISPPSAAVPSPLSHIQATHFAQCLSDVCTHLLPCAASDHQGADVARADLAMAEAGQAAGLEGGEMDTTCWEEAVYEAAAIMSSRVSGTRVLLQERTKAVPSFIAKGAFGTLPRHQSTSDLQVAALHALASLMGSERGESSHHPLTSYAGHTARQPAIATLPERVEVGAQEEGLLREALYYTAAGARGGPTLGGLLHEMLRREEAVRVAVYRLITVLVERPWGLAEVCGNSAVVGAITDPLSETGKEAMDWRHTAVVAAATSASAHDTASSSGGLFTTMISPETISKLEAAAKMGPYAVRRIIEARPVVAVEERAPMGL